MASSSPFLPLASAALLLLISAAPAAAARLHLANPLCINAPYPLLCSHLPAFHTPRAIAVASARSAAAKVSAAIPTVNQIRVRFAGNKRLAATLDICAEVYASAVDDLNKAADGLRGNGNHNDVMTYLSASLTDIGTCDDSFAEDPSLSNPITNISRNLHRLVTNSLALGSVVRRNL